MRVETIQSRYILNEQTTHHGTDTWVLFLLEERDSWATVAWADSKKRMNIGVRVFNADVYTSETGEITVSLGGQEPFAMNPPANPIMGARISWRRTDDPEAANGSGEIVIEEKVTGPVTVPLSAFGTYDIVVTPVFWGDQNGAIADSDQQKQFTGVEYTAEA